MLVYEKENSLGCSELSTPEITLSNQGKDISISETYEPAIDTDCCNQRPHQSFEGTGGFESM
jgi:hypothetical protein